MAMRKIVEIDAEKCNGCGLCVGSCAEGAIQLIDGKARLVKDDYCDGLGACLGHCPQDAIQVIEREAADFDEAAAMKHVAAMKAPASHAGGCPGMAARQFSAKPAAPTVDAPSALRQWPVQLKLVPPTASYFRDADLLLAADCAAFAFGSFHGELLADHALAIACPKLDDPTGYVEKLAAMISEGGVRSITVARMEVPCCGGLERLAMLAVQASGRDIPVRRVVIGIEGKILADER